VDVGAQTLEKMGMMGMMGIKFRTLLFLIFACLLWMACAAKILKYEKAEALKENKEFDQQVHIVETAPGDLEPAPPSAGDSSPILDSASKTSDDKKGKGKSGKSAKANKTGKADAKTDSQKSGQKSDQKEAAAAETSAVSSEHAKRQPEIESDEGFAGRRPLKDPFRVGEQVIHSVNYFKMQAGSLNLETRSFAMVNGKKNYQFRTTIKTSSFFSSFYSVDDYVDVLMDFEQLVPSVFTLHVKESAQLKEAQMLFDHQKGIATYWEKKVTDKNGEENKKQQWEILPYAQNVFSAAFYMRVFQWEVGKENAFHVADDEKNLTFRAKAIRKERISTEAGDFNAIVIRPEIELKGKFNPVGDNYIWLSDDDRKYILRIESKIKIGTLVSEVVQIKPGR
jgi:hypothetical protein